MDLAIFKPSPEKHYWIFSFPYHYTFVYYGTVVEARELFIHKCQWEGTGTMRLADPENKQDAEIVRDEIINVRLDREAGVPNLPFLPGKGWL